MMIYIYFGNIWIYPDPGYKLPIEMFFDSVNIVRLIHGKTRK